MYKGEAIGLDQDAFLRAGQCVHYLLGAARNSAVFWGEADSDFASKNVRCAKNQ